MKDDFSQYWAGLTADEKADLATKADTSVAYLSQIANEHRNAGNKTINSLIAADPQITLAMFFKVSAA